VPAAAADRLAAELWAAGTLGIQVVSEEAEHELLAWFPEDAPPDSLGLERLGARAEPASLPEVDWVARFREEFRGARAGCFRVRPVWREEPHEPGAIALRVDPGGAFGTGTHETTRLCLLELERLAPGRLAIDVGCGTGLLAIAALARGWSRAVALDLDPAATAEARRHATLNEAKLPVVLADGAGPLRAGCADLVLANLARELLLRHREGLASCLAPGGTAVISGLLREDVAEVEAAWGRHGRVRRRFEGEWAALTVETPTARTAGEEPGRGA